MKTDIYEMRSSIVKALGHPVRLKLLDILSSTNEKCVCELVEEVGSSQSTTSKHLSILKAAGILTTRKEGLKTYYEVRTPCVATFFSCLDSIIRADLEEKRHSLNH